MHMNTCNMEHMIYMTWNVHWYTFSHISRSRSLSRSSFQWVSLAPLHLDISLSLSLLELCCEFFCLFLENGCYLAKLQTHQWWVGKRASQDERRCFCHPVEHCIFMHLLIDITLSVLWIPSIHLWSRPHCSWRQNCQGHISGLCPWRERVRAACRYVPCAAGDNCQRVYTLSLPHTNDIHAHFACTLFVLRILNML